MPDLTEVIAQSIATATNIPDAEYSADEGDAEQDVGAADSAAASEPANEPAIAAEKPAADAAAAASDATKPAAADAATAAADAAFLKELESYGLKPPKPGRDNPIPYSRVLKIIKNGLDKRTAALTETHTKALKEHEEKLAAAAAAQQEVEEIQQLARTDPEQYLHMLAAVNPGYRRFLAPLTAEVKEMAEAAAAAAAKQDPMPKPDAKYADGSTGYSDTGLDALLEWKARQVEARVLDKVNKTYNERVGPMEREWKARQEDAARMPRVREQIAQAQQTWGELYTKHEAELSTYLQQHQNLSFETCVANVLVPKSRAERTTMREEILKELDARPGAAAAAAPAAVVAGLKRDAGPRNTEDVIREAIAGLK